MAERWIRASVALFDPSHDLHPMAEHEPACKAFAWLDLIAMARWRAGGGLGRGQLRASQRFLCARWNWSRNRVSRFLGMLEKKGRVLVQQRSQGGAVITICNYGRYHPGPTSDGATPGAANGAANGAKVVQVQVPGVTTDKPRRLTPPEPEPNKATLGDVMAVIRSQLGEPTRTDGSIAKQILRHIGADELCDAIRGLRVKWKAGDLNLDKDQRPDLRWLWSKKANALVPPFYVQCQQAYYGSEKTPARVDRYAGPKPVTHIGDILKRRVADG